MLSVAIVRGLRLAYLYKELNHYYLLRILSQEDPNEDEYNEHRSKNEWPWSLSGLSTQVYHGYRLEYYIHHHHLALSSSRHNYFCCLIHDSVTTARQI